jgi:uncharacterized cupredoxin-like copper-binding protein
MKHPLACATTLSMLLVLAPPALAHGDSHGAAKPAKARAISMDEHSFGRQGDPAKVTRTVEVDMSDAMRFSPAEIRVKQGETIRFVARNGGKVMHEMVLGNLAELKAHGEMMKKFPNMEHDEPYMAHVPPGKKQEIVWTFTKSGEFHFGCLLPGHLEAGMIGRVIVAAN